MYARNTVNATRDRGCLRITVVPRKHVCTSNVKRLSCSHLTRLYEQSYNFYPIRERERERERKLYPIDLCGGIDNGSARFTRNLEPWWNEADLSRGLIDKFVVGANVKMSMSMFLRLVYGGRYVASISQPLSLFELRSSPLTLPPR